MTDAALPWHDAPWSAWLRHLAHGRRAQGLLLTGARGVGKVQLAARMAAGLLCHAPVGLGEACGGCEGCRQHRAGSHPDAIVLRPDPDQPGALAHYPVQGVQLESGRGTRTITVDQVRALTEHLTRAPRPGGTRIAILWPADALAEAGANALLKILEEPPENALLMLIAHRPALLPATLRSRCQFLHVPTPAPEQARDWLAGEVPDPARRALAVQLAGDAPLLARELAGEDPAALWEAVAGGIAAVRRGADPVAVAADWQRFAPERVELALYAWLRAQLRAAAGGAAGRAVASAAVGSMVGALAPATVLLDELETLRRAARVALARPLAWEALLIRTMEAA